MGTGNEHRVAVNGVDLHVVEAGSGPAVVLSHGFPELGYSWRHQIEPLVAAGFRVIVPDQHGYGRSSRPTDIEDYDIVHLTDDLLGLLDHFGIESAAFVGHDWGANIVWHQALLHPERVTAVCAMSVAFAPRPPSPPIARIRETMGDDFYIVRFQEPGVVDAQFNAAPAQMIRMMMFGGATRPDWITEDEVQVYAEAFGETGFTGGVNWYRNFDRNWTLTEALDGAHVTVPSLFIAGRDDGVLSFMPTDAHATHLDDHRGDVLIDGAGHWIQQERPAEVNDAFVSFLVDTHRR